MGDGRVLPGCRDTGGRVNVVHIVWSPRRIEQSLAAHELVSQTLGIQTAFVVGFNEHEGCAVANHVVRETQADLYLFSYDDQCPTVEQAEHVLELQQRTGDVVSGWQLLGQDSAYGSATRPSWGTRPLAYCGVYDPTENGEAAACYYRKEELRDGPELLPSHYFAALTAVPRAWLLEAPIWSLPSPVSGQALKVWPSPDGRPYDKGAGSDWTMAMDLIQNGHKVWIATKAEILHLAPKHGIPHYRFWMAEERGVRGVFWGRRPRHWGEFARRKPDPLPARLPMRRLNEQQTGLEDRELVLAR